MFGERCTLCGGKLDSRKICTECGLNNSKSEKHYQVNRSSCDGRPMTHVHRDEEKEKRRKPIAKPVHQKKKARWAARFATAFVVLSILGTIVGSIVEIGGEFFSDSDSSYERPDPYQVLSGTDAELPEEGTYEEFELPAGKYIVGVHIPAGNYQADMMNDYDSIRVNDKEHSIFMYEYPAQEGGNYLDDLRLFDGALVEISTMDTAVLITENAQTINGMENPLTKSYELEGNVEKLAGIDFEAGVYDLDAADGYGIVDIRIYPEETDDEENYEEERIFLGEGASDGTEFRNVIIPEGAKIVIEDDSGEFDDNRFKVTLTPSSWIVSTDYLQTYRDYY